MKRYPHHLSFAALTIGFLVTLTSCSEQPDVPPLVDPIPVHIAPPNYGIIEIDSSKLNVPVEIALERP
ncbi:hypothetical protein DYU11_29495 [Fibrisoma montanum]|uniref:Uncharacterized protein n=1 Tax=Fibrisoma montanum TaxID=2305895 RepID=A0A418LXX6_9BACT|nr:hypothetical protein [Fibrisoma montanum]RIV18092.1 hypothetical protein DYU11_29495 [Fibrisoma montanum]